MPSRRLNAPRPARQQRASDPPVDHQQQAISGQHRPAQDRSLSKAENDLKRRVVLGSVDAIGREELQHARDDAVERQAALEVAVQQYNANQAMVLNTLLERQPAIQQAAGRCDARWRCSVPK